VGATEIADNTIDSGEVIDFGLSNQDIGVLFAQVSDTGAVSNSSGNVTVIDDPVGPGTSTVDFGRNVSGCAAVVTQGEAGSGGAPGAITGVSDRSGNAEAFFVTTRNNANVLVNTAYQMMVVC